MRGKQPSGLLTQQKMLRGAVALFLEKGYERTATAEIARAAGMTPSSFFRAYPSKEAILLELVRWMFDGQFALARKLPGTQEPLMLYVVETALQIQIAELSESLRDLYVTAYTLPSTTDYIYQRMGRHVQQMFAPNRPGLEEKDFYELEIASGSIMRGFMAVPCSVYFTMERKLTRFFECTLRLYDVPQERRTRAIASMFQIDLRTAAEDIVRDTVRLAEEGKLIVPKPFSSNSF